jgi:tRNA nucleotidyltransferase/poly(A) polymerase
MGKHITIEDDVKRRDLTVNAILSKSYRFSWWC